MGHRYEVIQLASRARTIKPGTFVLDKEKQKEFASVAQATGVSLPSCRILLEVLLGGRVPDVSTLGRWTKAAGKKAGELLAVLDEFTYDKVEQVVADERRRGFRRAPTSIGCDRAQKMCALAPGRYHVGAKRWP
jgi:hypothetical protein